jgi:cell wall-associated NlpC family hydrolase
MNEQELRAAVVAEARTWLRTPFHHAEGIKGIGCDCVHLPMRVYQAVGLVEKEFNPGYYAQHWYMHQSEELYLRGLSGRMHRVTAARSGDLAMYKFGRTVSHAAIVIDDVYIIHAYSTIGAVVLQERSDAFLLEHLDSYWSIFK